MATFPTLSIGMDSDAGFRETYAFDPTLVSQMSNGARLTRPKFTAVLKQFTGTYGWLSNDDKETLDTFFSETVMFGAGEFNWINPTNGKQYTVKLSGLPVFEREDSNTERWRLSVTLIEARPRTETIL